MKIGRNDPCPCGSGRKYKKCCLNKQPSSSPSSVLANRSIRERNLILLSAIWDIFGFSKGKSWNDVRREMSNDQIRELYRVVGWLWSLDTDIISLLPKPDSKLRGFYMGETKPDFLAILQNIVRYSLYTDEILVVSPFMNPRCLAQDFNPLVHPELYKQDTLEMVYFVLKLFPWIESGIVNLIPDPADFDYSLRKAVWGMAEKRWKEQGLELSKETLAEIEPRGKRMLEKTMYRLPKDQLAISIKRALPQLTDKQLADQIEYVQKLRKKDPMIIDQELPPSGELHITRYGANLELGLYIGQLTGSYLYTDKTEQWDEILSSKQTSPSEPEVWSPLTKSFQSLEFNFLDKIDPQFAYRLKEEGRLDRFRHFLRKVWVDIGGNPSVDQADKLAREYGDELQEEYAKTKEEWAQIDKDLLKWLSGSTGISAVISTLAKGGLDWQIPTAGFCITGVLKLLQSRTDRKNFRQNVSLAVFLDLEKKGKLIQ